MGVSYSFTDSPGSLIRTWSDRVATVRSAGHLQTMRRDSYRQRVPIGAPTTSPALFATVRNVL
jgi:hypothetical protein